MKKNKFNKKAPEKDSKMNEGKISAGERKRARRVLDDLLECESGLSAREVEFIEDMDGIRERYWSQKQIDWLDKIYSRVCW